MCAYGIYARVGYVLCSKSNKRAQQTFEISDTNQRVPLYHTKHSLCGINFVLYILRFNALVYLRCPATSKLEKNLWQMLQFRNLERQLDSSHCYLSPGSTVFYNLGINSRWKKNTCLRWKPILTPWKRNGWLKKERLNKIE